MEFACTNLAAPTLTLLNLNHIQTCPKLHLYLHLLTPPLRIATFPHRPTGRTSSVTHHACIGASGNTTKKLAKESSLHCRRSARWCWSSVLGRLSCWLELWWPFGCRLTVVCQLPVAELTVVTWLLLSCCYWLVVAELPVVDWLSLNCLLLTGCLWAACCWLLVSEFLAVDCLSELLAVDWLFLSCWLLSSWLLLTDCCQVGFCWRIVVKLPVVDWLLSSWFCWLTVVKLTDRCQVGCCWLTVVNLKLVVVD